MGCGRAGKATDNNKVRCMHIACLITIDTHNPKYLTITACRDNNGKARAFRFHILCTVPVFLHYTTTPQLQTYCEDDKGIINSNGLRVLRI